MAINDLEELAIKYKKIKLNSDTYILIPASVVVGYSMGREFLAKPKMITTLEKEDIIQQKFLIDSIASVEDLRINYEYDGDDIDFLKEYYFEEKKNDIIIIEIKFGRVFKRTITIPAVEDLVGKEMYERQNNIPSVVLNDSALQELLEQETLDGVKNRLLRLKNLIGSYLEQEKEKGVTRIVVNDGKVSEIETNRQVDTKAKTKSTSKKAVKSVPDKPVSTDFSVLGLEKYIKERVFGHDEAIEDLATTLYMNTTATKAEKIESFLIIGPTGTGKTETLNAAAEYLSIPFEDINVINLVPQGIKGESLEDHIESLIASANYDLQVASRGIVLLDEFDKLGIDETDYKSSIKSILLKFTEGGLFKVEGQDEKFNTKMLTKIFAGAFTDIYEREKTMGFSATSTNPGREISAHEALKKIKEKGYYGRELLTRINNAAIYHELDQETKKRVLLESKLSEYLEKKKRYERQFGVRLIAEESYIKGVLEKLEAGQESMRELNNLVIYSLKKAEHTLAAYPGKYYGKKLILTRDTVDKPENFTLC